MLKRTMARGAARALVAAGLALASSAAAEEAIKIDSETFEGLRARCIGPAAMSGRIAAIDAVQTDRLHIWVGSAGGGVWRSLDGGTTFKPVFDKHTQSIGAVAVVPGNPKTVWVGTGEAWTRNSVSAGDGIYKTTDGGDTWQRMGLDESERIARIVVDPQHPETVYAAVTGHLWNAHPMRGVYRTRDGGRTWERVLFVNEDTGCADIAMEPGNPQVLYAAMWQFRRRPWSFSSGGPGSGFYKSVDGGATWKKLANGLPAGALGRIAVSVSPAMPSRVYAVVEAQKTALFRSDDAGATWREMNSSANIVGRPFYFAYVVADPRDSNRVYKPGFSLTVSDDGGRAFSGIAGSTHADHHALWINPTNTEQLILGTDGGVYMSEDRGNHWRFLANLPVSQFYHVSYDMAFPYNVYGGLQDNGTWTAPSRRRGGIANRHWRNVGGGDGFWAFVDPTDADIAYVEYQGGNILRVRLSTGETKEIKPFPGEDDPELRFNWNAPIHVGRSGALYLGAQSVLRSRDKGDSWERISPDLTTDDLEKLRQEESGGLSVDNSSAENHCTVYTIAESPKSPQLIWAGTDDGNLQLTRDGGKSWSNVAKNITGLPKGTWVSCLEPSHFDEGTCYAAFDGHALGDMKTYVYRTTDFGRTWQPLATADLRGYAHVVREDLVRAEVVFVGTELGLFVTVDGGRQWAQLKSGLPNVSVRDLAIHPREHDLLVATHGRGVYIVDDLSPLRSLTPGVLASDVAFLDARPARIAIPSSEQRFDGDAEFEGENPSESAVITYYLKKRHLFGDLKLEVYDAEGRLLSSLPGGKRRGVNRAEWPMRLKPPKVPPAANLVPQAYSFVGPRVLEGAYTVRLIKSKDTLTSQVKLEPDPRSTHSAEDRAVQNRTALRLYRMLETLTYTTDALTDVRDQARARAGGMAKGDALARKLTAFADRLEDLRRQLVATREGRVTGEERLREKLASLYGAVNGYDGRPTRSQLDYAETLGGKLEKAVADFEALAAKETAPLNQALAARKLEPLTAMTREEWQRKQERS